MKTLIHILIILPVFFASCNKKESAEITPDPTDTLNSTKPVVNIKPVTGITDSSASVQSEITEAGSGPAIIARGVVWGTAQNPDIIKNPKTNDGAGAGPFESVIKNLDPVTSYYTRAYAVTDADTVYSVNMKFTTTKRIGLPIVTTNSVTPYATSTTAECQGGITDLGGGTIAENGMVWGTDSNLSVNYSSKVSYIPACYSTCSFSNFISGLQPGKIYYVRAYATNEAGTAYGNAIEFVQLNPYWQNLDLYKDENTNTIIGAADMDAFSAHFSSSTVRNGFALPEGVSMYIYFEEANDLLYYTIAGVGYKAKAGDTVYIPKDSTVVVDASTYSYSYGSGRFTIHIAGRSTSADNTYYCKYVDKGGSGITFVSFFFESDTSYSCEYKH